MLGDQRHRALGDNILAFLARYLDAQPAPSLSAATDDYESRIDYGVPRTRTSRSASG